MEDERIQWQHVCASFYRPLGFWLRLDQPFRMVDCPDPLWQQIRSYTWLLTETPLPPATLKRFDLEHTWSVIE